MKLNEEYLDMIDWLLKQKERQQSINGKADDAPTLSELVALCQLLENEGGSDRTGYDTPISFWELAHQGETFID